MNEDEIMRAECPDYKLVQGKLNRAANSTVLGLCLYRKKEIRINNHLYINRKIYPSAYISVFLHEVAHTIEEGEKHNWRWRETYEDLLFKYADLSKNAAYTAERKFVNEVIIKELNEKAKCLLVCQKCGEVVPRKKKPKYSTYRHKNCGGIMTVKYKAEMELNGEKCGVFVGDCKCSRKQ